MGKLREIKGSGEELIVRLQTGVLDKAVYPGLRAALVSSVVGGTAMGWFAYHMTLGLESSGMLSVLVGAEALGLVALACIFVLTSVIVWIAQAPRRRKADHFRRRRLLAYQLMARATPFADDLFEDDTAAMAKSRMGNPREPMVRLHVGLKGNALLDVEVNERWQKGLHYDMSISIRRLTRLPGLANVILPGPLKDAPQIEEGLNALGQGHIDVKGIKPAWRAVPSAPQGDPGILLAEVLSRILGAVIPAALGEHKGLRYLVSSVPVEVIPDKGEQAEPVLPETPSAALAIPRAVAQPAALSALPQLTTWPQGTGALVGCLSALVAVWVTSTSMWATALMGTFFLTAWLMTGWTMVVWWRLQQGVTVRKIPAGAPELGIEGGVLCLGGDVEGGIDGDKPFSLALTRATTEGGGDYLGLELTQRREETGRWNRLRFRAPVQKSPALEQLQPLKTTAAVVDPVAFKAWLWPWIRHRAAAHGQRPPVDI